MLHEPNQNSGQGNGASGSEKDTDTQGATSDKPSHVKKKRSLRTIFMALPPKVVWGVFVLSLFALIILGGRYTQHGTSNTNPSNSSSSQTTALSQAPDIQRVPLTGTTFDNWFIGQFGNQTTEPTSFLTKLRAEIKTFNQITDSSTPPSTLFVPPFQYEDTNKEILSKSYDIQVVVINAQTKASLANLNEITSSEAYRNNLLNIAAFNGINDIHKDLPVGQHILLFTSPKPPASGLTLWHVIAISILSAVFICVVLILREKTNEKHRSKQLKDVFNNTANDIKVSFEATLSEEITKVVASLKPQAASDLAKAIAGQTPQASGEVAKLPVYPELTATINILFSMLIKIDEYLARVSNVDVKPAGVEVEGKPAGVEVEGKPAGVDEDGKTAGVTFDPKLVTLLKNTLEQLNDRLPGTEERKLQAELITNIWLKLSDISQQNGKITTLDNLYNHLVNDNDEFSIRRLANKQNKFNNVYRSLVDEIKNGNKNNIDQAAESIINNFQSKINELNVVVAGVAETIGDGNVTAPISKIMTPLGEKITEVVALINAQNSGASMANSSELTPLPASLEHMNAIARDLNTLLDDGMLSKYNEQEWFLSALTLTEIAQKVVKEPNFGLEKLNAEELHQLLNISIETASTVAPSDNNIQSLIEKISEKVLLLQQTMISNFKAIIDFLNTAGITSTLIAANDPTIQANVVAADVEVDDQQEDPEEKEHVRRVARSLSEVSEQMSALLHLLTTTDVPEFSAREDFIKNTKVKPASLDEKPKTFSLFDTIDQIVFTQFDESRHLSEEARRDPKVVKHINRFRDNQLKATQILNVKFGFRPISLQQNQQYDPTSDLYEVKIFDDGLPISDYDIIVAVINFGYEIVPKDNEAGTSINMRKAKVRVKRGRQFASVSGGVGDNSSGGVIDKLSGDVGDKLSGDVGDNLVPALSEDAQHSSETLHFKLFTTSPTRGKQYGTKVYDTNFVAKETFTVYLMAGNRKLEFDKINPIEESMGNDFIDLALTNCMIPSDLDDTVKELTLIIEASSGRKGEQKIKLN